MTNINILTLATPITKSAFVVKNFALTRDQSEWLRTHAYETRQTQAAIVRGAIDRERARVEAPRRGRRR